jgi:hypothetical protein
VQPIAASASPVPHREKWEFTFNDSHVEEKAASPLDALNSFIGLVRVNTYAVRLSIVNDTPGLYLLSVFLFS